MIYTLDIYASAYIFNSYPIGTWFIPSLKVPITGDLSERLCLEWHYLRNIRICLYIQQLPYMNMIYTLEIYVSAYIFNSYPIGTWFIPSLKVPITGDLSERLCLEWHYLRNIRICLYIQQLPYRNMIYTLEIYVIAYILPSYPIGTWFIS